MSDAQYEQFFTTRPKMFDVLEVWGFCGQVLVRESQIREAILSEATVKQTLW